MLAFAQADAFAAWAHDRRHAAWEGLHASGDVLPLAPAAATQHDPVPITHDELVFLDYHAVGMSIAGHPMASVRDKLVRGGAIDSRDLMKMPNGRKVTIGGLVTVRQRPATAGGTIFLLLEDEWGYANIVVPKPLVAPNEEVVKREPFVLVQGRVENDGSAISIVGQKFKTLDVGSAHASGARVSVRSRPPPQPFRGRECLAEVDSRPRASDDPTSLRSLLLLVATPAALLGQGRVHTITGRVTTDSGTAIPAADVIVTIAPTTESIAEKTDASGAYKLVIPAEKATGEYLLYIGALGRRPFRQRVTIKSPDSTAAVDAKLAAVVTKSRPSKSARRTAPAAIARRRQRTGDPGGRTQPRVDGVANSLPPELQGNFDAMATLIPGLAVTATASRRSVWAATPT